MIPANSWTAKNRLVKNTGEFMNFAKCENHAKYMKENINKRDRDENKIKTQ